MAANKKLGQAKTFAKQRPICVVSACLIIMGLFLLLSGWNLMHDHEELLCRISGYGNMRYYSVRQCADANKVSYTYTAIIERDGEGGFCSDNWVQQDIPCTQDPEKARYQDGDLVTCYVRAKDCAANCQNGWEPGCATFDSVEPGEAVLGSIGHALVIASVCCFAFPAAVCCAKALALVFPDLARCCCPWYFKRRQRLEEGSQSNSHDMGSVRTGDGIDIGTTFVDELELSGVRQNQSYTRVNNDSGSFVPSPPIQAMTDPLPRTKPASPLTAGPRGSSHSLPRVVLSNASGSDLHATGSNSNNNIAATPAVMLSPPQGSLEQSIGAMSAQSQPPQQQQQQQQSPLPRTRSALEHSRSSTFNPALSSTIGSMSRMKSASSLHKGGEGVSAAAGGGGNLALSASNLREANARSLSPPGRRTVVIASELDVVSAVSRDDSPAAPPRGLPHPKEARPLKSALSPGRKRSATEYGSPRKKTGGGGGGGGAGRGGGGGSGVHHELLMRLRCVVCGSHDDAQTFACSHTLCRSCKRVGGDGCRVCGSLLQGSPRNSI
eukprot:Rhum_TRINITY_DN8962_c0_g1::Rhum_TRINITY_DN8962_c0_g1_i1::g.30630::m.30630